MTLTQVWGTLLIFIVCPLLGGVPLIAWITHALAGRRLETLGTGNISVSAAFYHGGTLVGILAVLSEAFKGIAAVMLARGFFPDDPEWELIALIALVMGRYWMGKGAGTTNVVWGFVVHDLQTAGLVFLIGGISFTILREQRLGQYGILILFPLILALLHPYEYARIGAAIALGILLNWIYQKIPDDLDLSPELTPSHSQKVFRFFRNDRAMISLDSKLDATKVGQKAATLSQLKRWGYSVPDGWVLPPGDDAEPMIESLQPSEDAPLVVRSSAIGEDSEQASAAGQYESILNVTSPSALQQAILRCQVSYSQPGAREYRRDRFLPESAIAVLIQKQVRGVFSGVAFSRDPITQHGDIVVIEALPGAATQVVSGQITPEQYRVVVSNGASENTDAALSIEGEGNVPPALIRQVALLARELETRFQGIPQDIEWSYDGQTLWLLQSRPITTLLPIWTRKIAAEVIPGAIRPLTWSINRPLTCGVWGEIFTLVLGKQALGLDFNQTATLHYSRAYFNASLLGQIFRRMGLPPESLEFLTRGAKFSKPPLGSTWQNLPGLLRLLRRELLLGKEFQRDYRQRFAPALAQLAEQPALLTTRNSLKATSASRDPAALLQRVDSILELLRRATYYSILAPLSLALRQAMLGVQDGELDASQMPEVASLRSLQELAAATRHLVPFGGQTTADSATLFAKLADIPDGESVLAQFNQFLNRYGYLSDVGTDISVPTWKEDPSPVRELFAQFLFDPPKSRTPPHQSWKAQIVQRQVNLKGRVTRIYSQLLAQLRWSFVALEQIWLESGLLSASGDIFFLELEQIRRLVANSDQALIDQVSLIIERGRRQLERERQLDIVPFVVYGNAPPVVILQTRDWQPSQQLQGIGASPGQAEGRVRVVQSLQAVSEIDRTTILVVPYTDSGWAPLLARAGGLIAEVGGRLSHGAIVAREYGIPAVMDIRDATKLFRDGQLVRIDGSKGIVELL